MNSETNKENESKKANGYEMGFGVGVDADGNESFDIMAVDWVIEQEVA